MKGSYPSIGLARFCRLLGFTRQAFYQHFWNTEDSSTEHRLVLDKVKELRQLHPAMGTRKLLFLLQSFLAEHQIKLGRDALFDLLANHQLLVRRRKRSIQTTQSYHWLRKHPNLLKAWHPTAPDQLWVADITYVPAENGFLYLNLITDAFSHKIVGYCMAESLSAVHTTKALQMALAQRAAGTSLIHHSDRGIQYCSHEYVTLLENNNIKISMTESGDPLENAIAERINGIIKNEYLQYYSLNHQPDAMKLFDSIVYRYNQLRPHQSINMNTPEMAHLNHSITNKKWPRKKGNPNIVNLYQD